MHNVFATYLTFLGARRAPLTVIAYKNDFALFRKFLGERRYGQPRAFDISMLDGYLIWLRQKKYAPMTIERRLQALRSFSKWAVRRGHLETDEFLLWEVPRAKLRLPRALSTEDDQLLLQLVDGWRRNAHDHMLALAIRLARFAGLRRGEVANLTWPDLSLSPEDQGRLIVRHGKGDTDRSVPLPQQNLVEPLKLWHAFIGRPVEGPVLKGIMGGALPEKSLSRGVHRYYRKMGIRYATFHTLRVTYATRLAEAGVHVSVIQQLLGHRSLETTMGYIIVPDSHKRAAARLLDGGHNGSDGPTCVPPMERP